MSKIDKLLSGKTIQLAHSEIEDVVRNFPNMSETNYNKLVKAYKSGKGSRLSFSDGEILGAGFSKSAKKALKASAKAVQNNKQLSKLKDQAINRGLEYALEKSDLDEDTAGLVKGLARKTINKQIDTLAGEGMSKFAKKSLKATAKAVQNNKQLSKLKDQAINRGLEYALEKSDLDEDTAGLVKGLARKTINKQIDTLAGEGVFNKKLGRKILKTGSKALKVGNKISNELGYDDLDDMAIDFATQQTLGRVDPTLARIASNQLNKMADKEIKKQSGGNVNPYLPTELRGGAIKVYNDKSNLVHKHSDAYKPSVMNDPMFDRLKLLQMSREI